MLLLLGQEVCPIFNIYILCASIAVASLNGNVDGVLEYLVSQLSPLV